MDNKIIKDITQEERHFLLYFRSRPAMYIGNNSINRAFTFLLGYKAALYNTNQTDKLIIPDEFTDYVALKYNESASMGWCRILLEQVNDEEKALWLFFDSLDDFLVINNFKPIGETSSGLRYRLRNCICRKEIFDNLNIDEVLKKRNLQEFQTEWHRIKDEIDIKVKAQIENPEINKMEVNKNEIEKPFKDKNKDDMIQDLYPAESFYKNIIYNNVYELCENEELAESISKDIDMIYIGSLVDYNDKWLDKLISEYKQYNIPC